MGLSMGFLLYLFTWINLLSFREEVSRIIGLFGCLSKVKALQVLTKADFRCRMVDSLCALFPGGDWSGEWTRSSPIPSLFPVEL